MVGETRGKIMERTALLVVALAVAFVLGFWTAEGTGGKEPGHVDQVKRDTVVVWHVDTLRVTEPHIVRESVTDTVRVLVPVEEPDGALTLTRVQREYSGDNYRAWVSGLSVPGADDQGPRLDSMDVRRDVIETIITEKIKEKPKRWGFGCNVGITYDLGNKKPRPYIGVGVSYNLIRW